MNIAVIAHGFFPIKQPFAGGLEAHTFHLVEELIQRGHTVTTYAKFGTDKTLHPKFTYIGSTGGGNGRLFELSFKITMRRIEFNNYDLIINNSLSHIPLEMHTLSMPPMLTIFHTPPLPKMVRVLKKQLIPVNRAYLAVSSSTSKEWKAATGVSAIPVSNGIDLTKWEPSNQRRSTRVDKLALWTGRITPEKGTHIAIEAAVKCGMPLIIAGNISNKSYFRNKVKPLLNTQIRYVGHKNTNELKNLYSQADVALITPLWNEPFGLVAIEALACGVPVAALPNGAMPFIVTKDVGAVAENVSADALALAIKQALKVNTSLCRPYVAHNFTLDTMVTNYLMHAEALIRQNSKALVWQPYR